MKMMLKKEKQEKSNQYNQKTVFLRKEPKSMSYHC